jgi:hypothetical protein
MLRPREHLVRKVIQRRTRRQEEGEVLDPVLDPNPLHEMSAAELVKLVKETDDLSLVREIAAAEPSHPRYEGGRSTVLNAAAERLQDS